MLRIDNNNRVVVERNVMLTRNQETKTCMLSLVTFALISGPKVRLDHVQSVGALLVGSLTTTTTTN